MPVQKMESEKVILALSQVFSPGVLPPAENSLWKSLFMEVTSEYKNTVSLVASLL